MGFLKELFRGFTMSTEDVIAEAYDVIAQEEKRLANEIKEREGLNYIRNIIYTNIFGIENEYLKPSLYLFDDRIRLEYYSDNKKTDIMFDNIESVEVMNTIQIEEKSKLGQMMVIGLFALATKKKTEEVCNNKLVINVCEYGVNYSIIVDTINEVVDEAKLIGKTLNEYKLRKVD